MRIHFFATACVIFLAFSANAKADPINTALDGKDVQKLAEKIIKGLRTCKQMRGRPNVVVSVENGTSEFLNKTHFAELLHAMIEGKTHTKPETSAPDFEIQVKIEAEKKMLHRIYSVFYTAKTTVSQSEERLCTKEVKYTKRIALRAGEDF